MTVAAANSAPMTEVAQARSRETRAIVAAGREVSAVMNALMLYNARVLNLLETAAQWEVGRVAFAIQRD